MVETTVLRGPYLGPASFGEQDSDLFFGRKQEINRLGEMIAINPFVLLHATSGVGKSSLLHAGLIPQLRQRNFQLLPKYRPSKAMQGSDSVSIKNFFIYNLLMQWATDDFEPSELQDMLLVDYLELLYRPTNRFGDPARRIVILDQLEEVFTLYPNLIDHPREFFEQIKDATNVDKQLTFVFSMRSDYIYEVLRYFPNLPATATLELQRLSPANAITAIEAPLDVINSDVRYAEGIAAKIVYELRTIRNLSGGSEYIADYVEPVHLQIVCANLWHEKPKTATLITKELADEYGNVDYALTRFYEDCLREALRKFDVKEPDLRDWFEKELITPTKRRAPAVYREAETTGGLDNRVVDLFENLHILQAELEGNVTRYYRLIHDRLIEPILASNEKIRYTAKQVQVQQTAEAGQLVLTKSEYAKIVDILSPHLSSESSRLSLLEDAFFGTSLLHQIEWSGDTQTFVVNLVRTAHSYGEIEPGKTAIETLLETVGVAVGEANRTKIEILLQSLRQKSGSDILETKLPQSRIEGYVFVAYARKDQQKVQKIIEQLKAAGVKIWIDQLGLSLGTSTWEHTLRQALKECVALVLFASNSSGRSEYVREELTLAQMYSKPIYPVWIEGESWIDAIPLGMGALQYLDARSDVQIGQAVAQLILTLNESVDFVAKAEAISSKPNFLPRNPYKGLSAFRAADRQDFFGRESFVSELIEQLRADPRFLVVIGASGSGKSSVVMAGLLPRLRDGRDIPASKDWIYLDPFVPGKYPLEALSIALAKHLPQKSQTAIMEDLLHPSTRGLHLLAKQISKTRLVLYIDQFEELFIQTERETERRQFIDLITTASHTSDSSITIILTLRADFYHRPLSYFELGTLVTSHQKAILPMTLADLYDVILKPAAQNDVLLTLEPGLAEEMVFSVKDEAGALPLLQFTLEQLFERRSGLQLTRAAYDDLGGVRGAVATRAEATYNALDAEGQRLAQSLFLRLIEPGATEQDTTRRRAQFSELQVGGKQNAALNKVVDDFVKSRLLTADQSTIEVSHEALVREWQRLSEWLHTARKDILIQQNISRDAAEWRRSSRATDHLYRGSRLNEALDWLARNKDSIVSHEEEMFIQTAHTAEMERISNEKKIQETLRDAEAALSQSEKLYQASRLINTAQNLEDLVLAGSAVENSPHLSFWLALPEGELDTEGWSSQVRVIAKSKMGLAEHTNEVHPLILPLDSPLRRREPTTFIDANESENTPSPQVKWLRMLDLRFMAIFPLYDDNQPIALFYIVSDHQYKLSLEDYDVYRAVTGQMSTQIQNRRLLERTEQALSETQRLFSASSAISAAHDTNTIYETLAYHLTLPYLPVSDRLQISVTIMLAYPEPSEDASLLQYVYWWNSTPAMDIPHISELVRQEDVPFKKLFQDSHSSVLSYNDLSRVVLPTSPMHALLTQGSMVSVIVASLQSHQRWLGVLVVRSNRPHMFDENYGRFLQALADQAVVAIERQALLQETERERTNLRAILGTLPAGVLVLDPITFKPIQANKSVEELLNQPVDMDIPFTAKHYHLYHTFTKSIYPDDELPIQTARRTNRAVFGDDIAVKHEDYHADLLVNAAPIYDGSGQIRAIVAAFQDISNLRSLEITLQENLRETISLYEAQRSLSQAESLGDILDSIMNQITMQHPGNAYIVLSRLEDQVPYIARFLQMPVVDIERLMPLLTYEVRLITNTSTSQRLDALLSEVLLQAGIESVLVLPLVAKTRQQPLGWFVITESKPNGFNNDEQRIYTTLRDMATTAIDNNYLVHSTQLALSETGSLYNATTNISRAHDLDALARAIETALATLHPDMMAGYLQVNSNGQSIKRLFSMGFDTTQAAGVDILTLMTSPIPNEGAVYIPDLSSNTQDKIALELLKDSEIRSFSIIELRVKDIPGARLMLGYRRPYTFSEGDVRFITSISDSASMVIDNQMLLEQIQSTLQETSILYQVSRALIEASKASEIIDVVAGYLAEPHINQVFIALLNTTSWYTPYAMIEIISTWRSGSEVDLQGVMLDADQFPAWRLLATEDILVIQDIYSEDFKLSEFEQISIESMDTRSLVIIPLRVGGRAIGAIWLGSQQAHTYTEQNIRIFRAFAEQASLSMEALRSLAEAERYARQLETSASISRAISQLLDLDLLLSRAVDLIRDSFRYEHVQVFLVDEKRQYANLRASTGEAGRRLLGKHHRIAIGAEGVIGRVTQTGQPTIALDTADVGVVHMPNPDLPYTRSELALPLIVKDAVVGALDVQSNVPNAFTNQDIQALTTLAAQISVGIENARLMNDKKET